MKKYILFLIILLCSCSREEINVPEQVLDLNAYQYPLSDSLLVQLQKTHSTAKKSNDYDLLTKATRILIKHYRLKTEFREVFILSDEYLQKMLDCQDTDRIADAYYLVGAAYFNSGLPSYALDYFLKMAELPLDHKREAKVNYVLGETSRSINKNQGLDPLKYYRTCEKIARQLNDSSMVAFSLFGQSQVFFDSMGGYKLGIFSERVKDSLAKSTRFLEEAVMDWKGNNVSFMAALSCNYAAMERYEDALSWKHKIEAYRDNPDYTALTFNCLAAIDNYMGNWDESVSLCKQAIEHARKFSRMADEHHATDILAYAYKGKSDYPNAVKCMIRVREMENDLRSNENNIELMATQVKYDLKDKEQTIARQHIQWIWTVTISGIIILALTVITSVYRQKQKTYRALIRKNQEWAGIIAVEKTAKDEHGTLHEDAAEDIDKRLMNAIETLMEKSLYKNPDLTIDILAEKTGSNPTYISKAISRCTGKNFKAYINELRIKESIRILSDINTASISVDTLAFDSGFSDRKNFHRVFKKITSLSPTDFRKNSVFRI